MSIHEGKRFECDKCLKTFSTQSNLKNHDNFVHEKQKRECPTCGKKLVGEMKRHIQSVHEGKKDYKCNSCDKMFFSKAHLKRHFNGIHKGIKRFK